MPKINPIYVDKDIAPLQNSNVPVSGVDLVNLTYFDANALKPNTVTTTDNTITTIATIAVANNTVILISAYISGRRTDAPDRAGYHRQAVVYREGGGAATIQGTIDTQLSRESNNAWDATIEVSGNNALIRVTGDTGATVNWKCQHLTVVTA